MNNKTHLMLMDYKLNVAQTHETAHQLHYTIHEFKNMDESNRDHLIGKLKFFIDLYTSMSNILHINETVVIDNYYQFLDTLAQDFNDDDFCDVVGDYFDYFANQIINIFKYIDDNAILDVDEVLNYVGQQGNLNFQEQQFIMDIYYANCSSYKLQFASDNSNETDYHDCRVQAAINDYCKEHNLQPNEVLVREMYDIDGNKVYTAQEFYDYLLNQENIDLDFVRDYDDIKTIKEWICYTATTLREVNIDLNNDPTDFDKEIIESNNKIIDQLEAIIF